MVDDEGVVIMVDDLFVDDSLQVAEVHHHAVFRAAIVHDWVAFYSDAHFIRMTMNVTASAIISHEGMSCFKTKDFCKMNHYSASIKIKAQRYKKRLMANDLRLKFFD